MPIKILANLARGRPPRHRQYCLEVSYAFLEHFPYSPKTTQTQNQPMERRGDYDGGSILSAISCRRAWFSGSCTTGVAGERARAKRDRATDEQRDRHPFHNGKQEKAVGGLCYRPEPVQSGVLRVANTVNLRLHSVALFARIL